MPGNSPRTLQAEPCRRVTTSPSTSGAAPPTCPDGSAAHRATRGTCWRRIAYQGRQRSPAAGGGSGASAASLRWSTPDEPPTTARLAAPARPMAGSARQAPAPETKTPPRSTPGGASAGSQQRPRSSDHQFRSYRTAIALANSFAATTASAKDTRSHPSHVQAPSSVLTERKPL
jgi:hypothetical protein